MFSEISTSMGSLKKSMQAAGSGEGWQEGAGGRGWLFSYCKSGLQAKPPQSQSMLSVRSLSTEKTFTLQ